MPLTDQYAATLKPNSDKNESVVTCSDSNTWAVFGAAGNTNAH
jgi:hypothetical protein